MSRLIHSCSAFNSAYWFLSCFLSWNWEIPQTVKLSIQVISVFMFLESVVFSVGKLLNYCYHKSQAAEYVQWHFNPFRKCFSLWLFSLCLCLTETMLFLTVWVKVKVFWCSDICLNNYRVHFEMKLIINMLWFLFIFLFSPSIWKLFSINGFRCWTYYTKRLW